MSIKMVLNKSNLIALVLLSCNNIFSQEKIKQDQEIPPVQSFIYNEGVSKNVTQDQTSQSKVYFDKYDTSKADYNNFNNYSASVASTSTTNGQNSDIGLPANSPFQLGNDISGSVQNSINQVTGKVAFSIPLASITSSSVSYSLSLAYDGQSSFKTAKELNKYNPTSVVGVGWSMSVPKIVVNNKQTTTLDDDDFYMIDGSTNSKLICINKESEYWEFQTEKYIPWKIKYFKGHTDWVDNGVGGFVQVYIKTDFWQIIKEDGSIYTFGYSSGDSSNTSKSKQVISSWENWIGDSNQSPTGTSTIVWNLSKISDQWGNHLNFIYELVEGKQNSYQTLNKHTEASYLKQITSSKGAKIILNYGFKNIEEYYEPHQEISEPDAYQEQYEKKFLQDVEVYNSSNTKTLAYNFQYEIYFANNYADKKRYLTKISQTTFTENLPNTLPSQEFEYNTSGIFKGGIKKIIYPSGGSVDYNYENKYLFYNGANRFEITPVWPSGYNFYSTLVKDNYCLYVFRTVNPVSNGKHSFKFFRYWWDGQHWKSNEFTFPHLIEDNYPNSGERLKDFYAVIEDDFYGFAYDYGTNADVFLFHKSKNGNDWDYYSRLNINIADEDPVFISGNGFAALGSHRSGNLHTFVWNGSSWNFQQISQGAGQYYYAANNNFIISLDEDGGADVITNINHEDNYYIHYLDAEKKWKTKSWSSFADPYISGIEDPSKFFPSNSIAGFVAADNPELLLRWDENYNLIAIDNVLGAYNDAHSIEPVNNSMFTLVWYFDKGPTKTARFNGVNWSVSDFISADYEASNFGLDFITYKNNNTNQIMYKEYSPNYHNWVSNDLNSCPWYSAFQINGVNSEFFIARNKIFKRSIFGAPSFPVNQIGSIQYDNAFTYTDGLSHAYIKEVQYTDYNSYATSEFKKGTYFYIDKENGNLASINLGLLNYLNGSQKIGGYTPFMSSKSLWLKYDIPNQSAFNPYLYRIIDDKFNQSVYDIVIKSIDLNDDNGNIRKINYTYNNPNSLQENNTTYYEEVIVENVGFGNSSIGKIKKIFNTGKIDIQMVGLQLEEHILDINNQLKKKTSNTWKKINKYASNSSYLVDLSYYVVLENNKEEFYYNNYISETLTNYQYNSLGKVNSIVKTNSKGQEEREDIRYAYEEYSFMNNLNFLNQIYETKTKLDNQIVDIKRNIFVNNNGKVYISEKWSGPNLLKLRLDSHISYVDNKGNALEATDGSGIYSAVLNGYSNLYEVAKIKNAKYQDVLNELDVTYSQLQNLTTNELKVELMKLYNNLPEAMISISLYDDNGRIINLINERKEETYFYYDQFNRLEYVTDGYGNVIERKDYNFGN